jgi:nitrite reductase/ring-hydroxylating ferredoxin subunit
VSERLTTTPPGVRLGPLDLIAEGTARNFVLEMKAGRFHGFAVRSGDTVSGYVDRCPHMGLPLAQQLDAYLTGDKRMIQCSWHGALFRIEDGMCVGGPCTGAALTAWPLEVRDGAIYTA